MGRCHLAHWSAAYWSAVHRPAVYCFAAYWSAAYWSAAYWSVVYWSAVYWSAGNSLLVLVCWLLEHDDPSPKGPMQHTQSQSWASIMLFTFADQDISSHPASDIASCPAATNSPRHPSSPPSPSTLPPSHPARVCSNNSTTL
jgi:hypothetical protein